jgi:hypothetical protein
MKYFHFSSLLSYYDDIKIATMNEIVKMKMKKKERRINNNIIYNIIIFITLNLSI